MNQLTFAQDVLVRNSMRNDRRHADACRARKVIHGLWCRAGAFRFEKGAPDLVKLARRHPRTDGGLHPAQRLRADMANGFEGLDIFLRVSGHGLIVMQKRYVVARRALPDDTCTWRDLLSKSCR